MDQGTFLLALVVAAVAVVILFKTAIVVPQQSAFIVERLGKYAKTLQAGFHILIPGIERIAYRHSLKEAAIDIAEQICITRDNVQVGIDGVLYLQVHGSRARVVRHRGLSPSRSRSSRRRRCAARSARSSSTARSRNAGGSTRTS